MDRKMAIVNMDSVDLNYLDNLITCLVDMQDDGYVHQVYSVMLQSMSTDAAMRLLAECLHKHWLSDAGFARLCARIVNEMCDKRARGGDVQFGSMVFGLLMNDFRDRHKLRATNPIILCNLAGFAFEFYNHFRKKDAFYATLVEPLLDMLELLMSNDCNEHEIDTASGLLQIYGPHLQSMKYARIQQLCVRARRILIVSDHLTPQIRYRLLEIIELSQNRWEGDALPVEVTKLYAELQFTMKSTAVTSGRRTQRHRSQSATADEADSRQSSEESGSRQHSRSRKQPHHHQVSFDVPDEDDEELDELNQTL